MGKMKNIYKYLRENRPLDALIEAFEVVCPNMKVKVYPFGYNSVRIEIYDKDKNLISYENIGE